MNKNIIYNDNNYMMYVDITTYTLYIEIIDGEYNSKNFEKLVEYYKNFWFLVNNSPDKYYQVFILNNIKIYPFSFYDTVFKTLTGLEEVFLNTLHSSCLVNDSNAMDIFRPLLNMYKAVRPFNFVKTLDEGHTFVYENINIVK
jgi:hypothetical protein